MNKTVKEMVKEWGALGDYSGTPYIPVVPATVLSQMAEAIEQAAELFELAEEHFSCIPNCEIIEKFKAWLKEKGFKDE